MAGALWPAARLSRSLRQVSDMDALGINRVMLFPTWFVRLTLLRDPRTASLPALTTIGSTTTAQPTGTGSSLVGSSRCRPSRGRPTRAGSLWAPQGRLQRLRPSAANSRRHQRPGAPSAAAPPALRSMFPPTPLTLGSRRWHKLNSAPRAETDQRRSRQVRAARRPQLPHALRAHATGRNRRISFVAGRPGEGPLTEPPAATQPRP